MCRHIRARCHGVQLVRLPDGGDGMVASQTQTQTQRTLQSARGGATTLHVFLYSCAYSICHAILIAPMLDLVITNSSHSLANVSPPSLNCERRGASGACYCGAIPIPSPSVASPSLPPSPFTPFHPIHFHFFLHIRSHTDPLVGTSRAPVSEHPVARSSSSRSYSSRSGSGSGSFT